MAPGDVNHKDFKKSKNEARIDRVSKLPDYVLGHILSSLPTKCVVATSVLSKRWRRVFLLASNLDFDNSVVSNLQKGMDERSRWTSFRNFVDKVLLMFCKNSEINKFRLKCDWDFFYGESLGWNSHDYSIVHTWISVALFHRIKELDVCIYTLAGYTLPISLFTSESLAVLKLDANLVLDAPFTLCLPSLKILHLKSVKLATGFPFNKFLSSFPSLEEFAVERIEWESMHLGNISAPSLRSLTLDVSAENLDVLYSLVVGLLKGAPNVKRLHLLNQCIEVLLHGDKKLSKLTNLNYLELSWSNSGRGAEVLSILFNSTPFLEILVFSEAFSETVSSVFWETQTLAIVPDCFKSHLKVIKVLSFRGFEQELDFLKYLLKSAEVLKKLVIDCEMARRWEPDQSLKKLLNLPKASKTCSITLI